MRVIPVAGSDSMLLNLSGAHAPFFTRNLVVLTDDAGHTGAGEVPGGERIRQVLEQASSAIGGQQIAATTRSSQPFAGALPVATRAAAGGRRSTCAFPCMC